MVRRQKEVGEVWRIEPEWFRASRMDIYYELWEDDHSVELRCKVCGDRYTFPQNSEIAPNVLFIAAAQHMIACPLKEVGGHEPEPTTG